KALNLVALAMPEIDSVNDSSQEITGQIPYEIKDAKVTVYNEDGSVLGTVDVKSGFIDFTIDIPRQQAGTLLYVSISDNLGNSSGLLEITVEKLDYQENRISLLGHIKNQNV